jgi:hypothetical protein
MKTTFIILLLSYSLTAQINKKAKNTFVSSSQTHKSSTASGLYSFSTFTTNYQEITGTLLSGGLKWDDLYYPVPLGFDFKIYESENDTVTFSEASFVTFNDAMNDPLVTFASPMFEDLCDKAFMPQTDMEGDNGGVSPVSYTITGNAGSRVCIIQVKNAGFFEENNANNASVSAINFQLWLYETSHDIEFRYGVINIQNKSLNLINPLGFLCGMAEDMNFNSLSSSNSDVLSGPQNSPTKSTFTGVSQVITGQIESGRVYKFTRIHPNPVAINEKSNMTQPAIYPNPASDLLHIGKAFANSNNTMEIYDPTGKLLLSEKAKEEIDLSQLKKGVYIVKISGDRSYVSKLVIVK